MTSTADQVPLRLALEFTYSENGKYHVEFPPSACFGAVLIGGLPVSFIHKAAVDFASRSPRIANHPHVRHVAVQYFRPTFPAPQKGLLTLRPVSLNKEWTTLHAELAQNDKICVAGYVTLTNLSLPGQLSKTTGWTLSPPPLPVSVQALEADSEPGWVSYHTPFTSTGFRRAQSYMKYFIPIDSQSRTFNDQWVTPGWINDAVPGGNVWTNELLHFALDNTIPPLNNILDSEEIPGKHIDIVKAGLLQREARKQGNTDPIWGERMTESDVVPWIEATVASQTEIKKMLPKDGVKWLFMRVQTKSLQNNRMDSEIVVMDEDGDLVALSHHIVQAIPGMQKVEKKQSIL